MCWVTINQQISKVIDLISKMKITTILGSPRKKGNTATILNCFEELINSQHEVERINISDNVVKGCLGCDACQKVIDQPGCVQKDDFKEIIEKVINSDIVVYASPIYVWDFSSQLKALIDRHCCLVKWKKRTNAKYLLEGKQTVLLATCGGSAESNGDLIQEVFSREMDYLHCQVLGKYIVPLCTIPSELGEKAKQTAQQMYDDFIEDLC